MKVLQLNRLGEQKTREILRREMAKHFKIHFRDLRPVYIVGQVATILARKNCIIINMGRIKLIFNAHELFIFNLEDKFITKNLVPEFIKFLRNGNKKTPFEFLVLEFFLAQKALQLKGELLELTEAVNKLLETFSVRVKDTALEKLLKLKKRISWIETTVHENEEAVTDILNEDENIELLYLTEQEEHRKIKDLNEAESILESFMEQMEVFASKVNMLKEDIDDTQEIITLKLGNRRNTIIRLDLIATLATFVIGLMTLLTGIFGMNLKNHLEENSQAFLWIIGGMILGGILLFILGWRFFKNKRVI
jgi:magnesium transporter